MIYTSKCGSAEMPDEMQRNAEPAISIAFSLTVQAGLSEVLSYVLENSVALITISPGITLRITIAVPGIPPRIPLFSEICQSSIPVFISCAQNVSSMRP